MTSGSSNGAKVGDEEGEAVGKDGECHDDGKG